MGRPVHETVHVRLGDIICGEGIDAFNDILGEYIGAGTLGDIELEVAYNL